MSGMLKNLLFGQRPPNGTKLSPRIGSEGLGLGLPNAGLPRASTLSGTTPWNGPLINNGVGVQPPTNVNPAFKRRTLMGGP